MEVFPGTGFYIGNYIVALRGTKIYDPGTMFKIEGLVNGEKMILRNRLIPEKQFFSKKPELFRLATSNEIKIYEGIKVKTLNYEVC